MTIHWRKEQAFIHFGKIINRWKLSRANKGNQSINNTGIKIKDIII